jgi:hypothetical protein
MKHTNYYIQPMSQEVNIIYNKKESRKWENK